MTNQSRARWSLAAALAAHALAMVWTVVRTPAPSRDRRGLREVTEVDIAVEPEPAVVAPTAPSEPPRVESPLPAGAARVVSRSSARGLSSAPASTEPRDAPSPVGSAEASAGGSWTFSPTQPALPSAGGSGGTDPVAMNKATAAGVSAVLEEWNKKAEDRKRKPRILTSRDMELGLVPGGQYVSITRDRIRDSLVPLESHALLEFWTDSRGIVARVRVIQASSDTRAWQDAADRLVEDAHGTFPLKVPSNADGLIVTLDVTSMLKTLSGSSGTASTLARVAGAVVDPLDALMDAKAVPRRIVAAKVVGVEAF